MIGPVESNLDNTKNTKITHTQKFSFIHTLIVIIPLASLSKGDKNYQQRAAHMLKTNTRKKAEFVNLLYTKKPGRKLAVEYPPTFYPPLDVKCVATQNPRLYLSLSHPSTSSLFIFHTPSGG